MRPESQVKHFVCRSNTKVYVLDGNMITQDKISPNATMIARRHDVVRGGSTILVLVQQASSFHEALF